jgi:hypothetical protein
MSQLTTLIFFLHFGSRSYNLARVMTSTNHVVAFPPTRRAWVLSANEHSLLCCAAGYDPALYRTAVHHVIQKYTSIAAQSEEAMKRCKFPFRVTLTSRLQSTEANECPLMFYRNMTKQPRMHRNVEKLMIRFLSGSYACAFPSAGEGVGQQHVAYDSDVELVDQEGHVHPLRTTGDCKPYIPPPFRTVSMLDIPRLSDTTDTSIIYVPITPTLVEDVMDLASRCRGMSPFAVMCAGQTKPHNFTDFYVTLLQYMTLLQLVFAPLAESFHHYWQLIKLIEHFDQDHWHGCTNPSSGPEDGLDLDVADNEVASMPMYPGGEHAQCSHC